MRFSLVVDINLEFMNTLVNANDKKTWQIWEQLYLLYEILFIMKAKANEPPVERTNLYLKVYRRKDGVVVTPRAQENK